MVVSIPLHIQQTLKRLGFSTNEIKIFLFLIQEKQSIADTISKRTIISLSTVEYLLKSLVTRGLIANTGNEQDKKEIYKACSEEDFIEWIEKQKLKNDSLYEEAKTEMGYFLKGLQETSWKPDVTYYEGKEGIIEIYEDMLNSSDGNIYSWIDIQKIHESLGEYLLEFINKRIEKNIKVYALMPKNKKNIEHESRFENRETQFLEDFDIQGEIRIYDNKVAVITFDKKQPVGFVFQGAIVTNLFKSIFQQMWKTNL